MSLFGPSREDIVLDGLLDLKKRERKVYEPSNLILNTESDVPCTWWAQQLGGNSYYRCEVPARHLPGQMNQLHFDDLRPYKGNVIMPRHRGKSAVWAFSGTTTRGILMAAQQAAGVRVLMEVDDNYLIDSPPVPNKNTDWAYSIKAASKDGRSSFEAHERLARMSDGVIVTTETLAQSYRRVNNHVYVCRNSIDVSDWDEPSKPSDGLFRIGYAASHSHWFDANDVRRALSWAANQPGVQVVMYGLDPGWGFDYLHVPWTKDLAVYRESLQLLDVGLCPLREGPWADGKSDVKTLEYAMSGAMSVVARRPPYLDWHDTDMALTATTPKDFLKHVKWCVANQDGSREIAARAKARVLAERTIETEIPKWREAVAA